MTGLDVESGGVLQTAVYIIHCFFHICCSTWLNDICERSGEINEGPDVIVVLSLSTYSQFWVDGLGPNVSWFSDENIEMEDLYMSLRKGAKIFYFVFFF